MFAQVNISQHWLRPRPGKTWRTIDIMTPGACNKSLVGTVVEPVGSKKLTHLFLRKRSVAPEFVRCGEKSSHLGILRDIGQGAFKFFTFRMCIGRTEIISSLGLYFEKRSLKICWFSGTQLQFARACCNFRSVVL